MAKYSFTKVGTIFAEDATGANQVGGYWATLLDTSDVPNWPWVVTMVSGFPHLVGVYLSGALTDPLDVGDWETYDEGKAAGRFAAWASATGQSLPGANPVYIANNIESPRVIKVGSTWYLMGHAEDGGIQYDVMLTATGGPLNFTLVSNGNGGTIIDPRDEPYKWTPMADEARGTAHRGYTTFGPNPFSGVPYDYVAYGISANNGVGYITQYGSDDLDAWDVLGTLMPERPFGTYIFNGATPTGYDHTTGFLVDSIRDAGGGEYCVLAGAIRSGASHKGVVELYLGADGIRCTRDPELILGLGGTGADDELRITPGGLLEWDGQILMVYRGQDAGAANYDDVTASSVMLAVGSYDANGSKGTARTVPPHDKYVFDGAVDTSLPAWMTSPSATPVTVSGGAINFPNDGTAVSLRWNGTFAKADHDWVEVWFRERHASADGIASPNYTTFVQFTEAAGNGQNYIRAYKTQGSRDMTWRYRTVNVDRLDAATTLAWGNLAADWEHGIQWRITDEEALWVRGPHRTAFDQTNTYRDLSGYTDMSGTDFYWAISTNNTTNTGGELVIEKLEFRAENPAGNTIPTITTAETTSTSTVTLTFDQNCIGDCSGITIKDGGSPVAGTWTRPTLTTAVFTRSSGTWSGALTYDISSTDIRSEADLVALADVIGETITPFGEPEPEPEPDALAFVGPAIGNRVLKQSRPAVISVASRFTGATSYSLTGTVPTGMAFSTVTGAISGTPTTIQTRTGLKITATDGVDDVDSDTFSIEIVEAPAAGAEGIIRSPIRGVVRYG